MFASPNHSPDCVPVIGPTHRDLLSTTTSDDVFLSSPRRDSNLPSLPRDRNETDGGMEGTSDKAGPQFDEFARKGPTLEHVSYPDMYRSHILRLAHEALIHLPAELLSQLLFTNFIKSFEVFFKNSCLSRQYPSSRYHSNHII